MHSVHICSCGAKVGIAHHSFYFSQGSTLCHSFKLSIDYSCHSLDQLSPLDFVSVPSQLDYMAGQTGIYLYEPSLAGALIAAAAFGASAVYHLIQMIRKRAWFYSPFTIGALSKCSEVS
jgi:hypothetical protein